MPATNTTKTMTPKTGTRRDFGVDGASASLERRACASRSSDMVMYDFF